MCSNFKRPCSSNTQLPSLFYIFFSTKHCTQAKRPIWTQTTTSSSSVSTALLPTNECCDGIDELFAVEKERREAMAVAEKPMPDRYDFFLQNRKQNLTCSKHIHLISSSSSSSFPFLFFFSIFCCH